MGRPKIFNSPEEMQNIIDEYFKDCDGIILKDSDGEIVLNKWERPIIIDAKPPTITGLALALGFNSRQTLLNYQENKAFLDTITRAKARVEAYAESRLYDKEGSTGAKFNLSNNFKGWSDKQEITNTNVNIDAATLTAEDRANRLAELKAKLMEE